MDDEVVQPGEPEARSKLSFSDQTTPYPPPPERTTSAHGQDDPRAGQTFNVFTTPPGYAIDRELGRGGMGVVFLASQQGLNRPVALKVLHGTGGPTGLIRFLAEADAVASIRHPHVVEVYQYGEHDGSPYLALEYCPGGSLNDRIQTGPPFEFRAAAEMLAKVAEGVQAAHALGIVHRDLKPHNVLLTETGEPKVTDFGLAKKGDRSDLTKTHAVMGTPAYMPPEQAKGEAKFVGPPADVWALGVVFYELLTGRRPFAGEDTWEVLAAVMRGHFPTPRQLNPAVPRDLELICLKCLRLEPHDRYATAGELAEDLRNWLAGKPIKARSAGVIERLWKWSLRNKAIAVAISLVMATLTTATIVSAWLAVRAIRAEAATAQQLEQTRIAEAEAKRRGDEARSANETNVRLLDQSQRLLDESRHRAGLFYVAHGQLCAIAAQLANAKDRKDVSKITRSIFKSSSGWRTRPIPRSEPRWTSTVASSSPGPRTHRRKS